MVLSGRMQRVQVVAGMAQHYDVSLGLLYSLAVSFVSSGEVLPGIEWFRATIALPYSVTSAQ